MAQTSRLGRQRSLTHDMRSHHDHPYSHDSEHNQGEAAAHSSDEEENARQERLHYQEIVNALAYYGTYAQDKLRRARDTIIALSDSQQKLLGTEHWARKWRRWELCIAANRALLDHMITHDPLFDSLYGSREQLRHVKRASGQNMDKVCSTLRQLVREWGAEGALERNECYTPLLDGLTRSGLGRLPWEICARGYASQGNEWSFFMLIAGNMVLNQCRGTSVHTFYPYIHQTSNVRDHNDLFRPVHIPDVDPSALPLDADFSYTAGGFLEVYGHESQRGQWDAVVTCFFVDTANNVIDYVRCIWDALRDGGVWLNLGPLLYHYSELEHEQSVELSLDELLAVVRAVGFEVREQRTVATRYTYNVRGMMHTHYDAEYWCAVKPTAAPLRE